jgi:hypothetical protein
MHTYIHAQVNTRVIVHMHIRHVLCTYLNRHIHDVHTHKHTHTHTHTQYTTGQFGFTNKTEFQKSKVRRNSDSDNYNSRRRQIQTNTISNGLRFRQTNPTTQNQNTTEIISSQPETQIQKNASKNSESDYHGNNKLLETQIQTV